MKEIELSFHQREWLKSRGGRSEEDVSEDADGYFVLMYSPIAVNKMEKVYLDEV